MACQSNALWPSGICFSKYGDDISVDVHETVEQAEAVCRGLGRDGFGGARKVFPLRTWVSEVRSPPVIPKQDGEDVFLEDFHV